MSDFSPDTHLPLETNELELIRALRSSGRDDEAMLRFKRIFQKYGGQPFAGSLRSEFSSMFAGEGEIPFSAPDCFTSISIELLTQQSLSERILLYGLTVGLRPKRVLEIGRARGGSTILIAAALKLVTAARFVSLDPNYSGEHQLDPALREKLTTAGVIFIDGFSPDENKNAEALAGGTFDFVFLDADHAYESVYRDLVGLIPILAPDATIALHDANYPGVRDAIAAVVSQHAFADCGQLGRDCNASQSHVIYRGKPTVWGGIHVLQYRPQQRSMIRSFRRIWNRIGRR